MAWICETLKLVISPGNKRRQNPKRIRNPLLNGRHCIAARTKNLMAQDPNESSAGWSVATPRPSQRASDLATQSFVGCPLFIVAPTPKGIKYTYLPGLLLHLMAFAGLGSFLRLVLVAFPFFALCFSFWPFSFQRSSLSLGELPSRRCFRGATGMP